MKFVILGKDGPDGPRKRPQYRSAHLQRLDKWAQLGKIILAGPLTDQAGSLIVVEAESLEEVQAFAKEDPYTIHGIFEEITIHPFLQVYPQSLEAP
jgi:uncharacterized protein